MTKDLKGLLQEKEQAEQRLESLKDTLRQVVETIDALNRRIKEAKAHSDHHLKMGQQFRVFRCGSPTGSDERYILAQTGPGEFNLIGLTTGNRWSAPLLYQDGMNGILSQTFYAHFNDVLEGITWKVCNK